ncbi:MAG: hypothetical protein AB8G77_23415 [Rhodothermales bacterium]
MNTKSIVTIIGVALMASAAASAGDAPENVVMLNPDEMKWKDNPRVPGLGVANIIGSGTKAGPFVYKEIISDDEIFSSPLYILDRRAAAGGVRTTRL